MTRQHRKPRSTNTEPKELGPDPVDITGKEPVLVRDWDADSLVGKDGAIRNMQIDIIDAELTYLLEQPAWNRRATKRFRHVMFEDLDVNIDNDIVAETLAKCQLDNLKVIYDDQDY